MFLAYQKFPYLSGNLKNDVCLFLRLNHHEHTLKHSLEVAEESFHLAQIFHGDVQKCYQAALLHDIAAVLSPTQMLAYAQEQHWFLDESEKRYPFLLHQRLSAVLAQDIFQINARVVLSAITHHTTLKADPNKVEMIVFIADKIKWDQQGMPPYLSLVTQSLDMSLERACYQYLDYQFEHHKLLYPHQWI